MHQSPQRILKWLCTSIAPDGARPSSPDIGSRDELPDHPCELFTGIDTENSNVPMYSAGDIHSYWNNPVHTPQNNYNTIIPIPAKKE